MQIVYNWHITQLCNYSCHYCYSTWGESPEIWQDKAASSALLSALSNAHTLTRFDEFVSPARLNIAGGEPLLIGSPLLGYLKEAKSLGLSTSIITNGALLEQYIDIVDSLDILGISIDSFDDRINGAIGRHCGGSTQTFAHLKKILSEAKKRNPSLKIKINTVVNKENWHSSHIPLLLELHPDKIKVFRQLPFAGEKGVSTTKFLHFLQQHGTLPPNVVVEDNADMIHSYLMIDPAGRFFQNGDSQKYLYSEPIQLIGLSAALEQIPFNKNRFKSRYKGSSL